MLTSCFSSTQLHAGELKADAAAVKRKAFLMAAVWNGECKGVEFIQSVHEIVWSYSKD